MFELLNHGQWQRPSFGNVTGVTVSDTAGSMGLLHIRLNGTGATVDFTTVAMQDPLRYI